MNTKLKKKLIKKDEEYASQLEKIIEKLMDETEIEVDREMFHKYISPILKTVERTGIEFLYIELKDYDDSKDCNYDVYFDAKFVENEDHSCTKYKMILRYVKRY